MSRTTVKSAVWNRTVATAVAAFTVAAAGGLSVISGGFASAAITGATIDKVGFDGKAGVAAVAARGPMDGSGDAVHVTGTGFTGATAADVTFGGVAADDVLVVGDKELWADPPAKTGTTTADAAVDVAVGNTTKSAAYEYKAAPLIAASNGINPSSDSKNVELTGTGLADAFAVTVAGPGYAGTLAVLKGVTATKASAKIPSTLKKGTYVVTVLTPWGSDPENWSYGLVPVVKKLSVATGTMLGGTTVTVTGTNLADVSAVKVDTATVSGANLIKVSDSVLVFKTPAFGGTPDTKDPNSKKVNIVLTNATGDSKAAAFTYLGIPTLTTTSFSGGDANGPLAGAEVLSLDGTYLTGAQVTVDSVTATIDKTLSSATKVTFKTPKGKTVGAKTVVVKTKNGSVTFAGTYTYNPALTLVSVSPDSAAAAGGTTITLTGTEFTTDTKVHFGKSTTPATTTYVSATSVTATVPAGVKGTTTVHVKDPDKGSSATKPFRWF